MSGRELLHSDFYPRMGKSLAGGEGFRFRSFGVSVCGSMLV